MPTRFMVLKTNPAGTPYIDFCTAVVPPEGVFFIKLEPGDEDALKRSGLKRLANLMYEIHLKARVKGKMAGMRAGGDMFRPTAYEPGGEE